HIDARVGIELEGHGVTLQAWRFNVEGERGQRVPVYLLDADLPENDEADRALTGQLYGGDQRYRLRQEALLGLGGLAMLRALGYDSIETYHLNEGHSALLTLSLLDELVPDGDFLRADQGHFEAIRRHCVFTTHTP